MLKYNSLLLFILSILLSTSCTISGSLGSLIGEQRKTKKEHPFFIKKATGEICSLRNTSEIATVYSITGEQLKDCIDKSPRSLVYIWSPNCSSDRCISILSAKAYAQENDLTLFIVNEYYSYERTVAQYSMDQVIFGIDSKHYNSPFTSKYLSGFCKDLGVEKENIDTFISFYNGKYSSSSLFIEDLKIISTKI